MKKYTLRLNDEEHENLIKAARLAGTTESAYIKSCIKASEVVCIDYSNIKDFLSEIRKIRSLLNCLLNSIIDSGFAYPEEISELITILENLSDTEKKILKAICKDKGRGRS